MDLYIKGVVASGSSSRSTAKLMKTGQTTSYRTGDDGDLEAGRNVDFTTLAENNPFGNTNRFTDELGTQTYTNNIVIDWSTYDGSTVLGWRRTVSATLTWNNAIDNALAVSISPYTTGWRLPNYIEIISISNFGITSFLNYSPFNLSGSNVWTSTTVVNSTTEAWMFSLPATNIQKFGKVNSATVLPCRTFTVTGTTLS
jgi:hypothetical protein